MMKNLTKFLLSAPVLLAIGLFLTGSFVSGQETAATSSPLPDNINKIVTASCMPCHSESGGVLARGKLNFTDWIKYSPSEQKGKAEKMYSVLKKGKMPPESARESRPEIIPTEDQIDAIKKWSESF